MLNYSIIKFRRFEKKLIFAKKTMDKAKIHKVLEDNILLENFSLLLIDEINNDDEILEKKARQLLSLCLNDEKADEFFIAICGWSVDSLLDKLNV